MSLELDLLVASKDPMEWDQTPNYSTDLVLAFDVIRRICDKHGLWFNINSINTSKSGDYSCSISEHHITHAYVTFKPPAEAICLAIKELIDRKVI